MPEGDSIVRIAAAMRPHLLDRTLRRVRASGTEHPALAGQRVVSIEPVGKHLLITTERGTVIRSHLGMNGRWYRHPIAKPPRHAPMASLLIETDTDVLTCTRAADVEIRDRRDPRYGATIARLGPDVLGASFDTNAVIARARSLPADTPAASLLLDQKVACGIGNIYKCESLFLEGVHPARELHALTDAQIEQLFLRARALMQANLEPGKRRTRGAREATRYWVYRRGGEPCHRCRTPIVSRVDGGEQRRTYWCPTCQPA
jgi:endonuclease VIII